MGVEHRPAVTSTQPEGSIRRKSELIGAKDRLADAIAADPAVAERLAAFDPRFEVLKDAPSSRPFDSGATIEDVAAATRLPVVSVLAAINAGRSGPCGACHPAQGEDEPGKDAPPWFSDVDSAQAARVDVGPILAARQDPFAGVMRAANALPPAGVLLIDAPFNPQPLRRVLEDKGFVTYGQRIGSSHWQIWCRRVGDGAWDNGQRQGQSPLPRIWRAGGGVHIDVRGLEAPRPLTSILALIDGGEHQGNIIVHLHRDPLYLYPELAERGWQCVHLPSPEGEVRLELRRDG